MTVIARCKGCEAEAILKPDQTIMAPCDCALRDPAVGLDVAEYVPASQLAGAVEALWQALVDLKGVAADSTEEAQVFVRETVEPRIRAAIAVAGGSK